MINMMLSGGYKLFVVFLCRLVLLKWVKVFFFRNVVCLKLVEVVKREFKEVIIKVVSKVIDNRF